MINTIVCYLVEYKLLLNKMKKALLSTIALALSIGSASAKTDDIYYGISTGYQRSSTQNKYYNITEIRDGLPVVAKNLQGVPLDLSIGYILSDNLRSDVTLNLLKNSAKVGVNKMNQTRVIYYEGGGPMPPIALAADKPNSLDLTEKGFALMGNVYYDFHNSSSFTPYVGGGYGVVRNKLEMRFSGTDVLDHIEKTVFVPSQVNTGFVYQGNMGVTYEATENIKLDLAYKLIHHSGGYYKYDTHPEAMLNGSGAFDDDINGQTILQEPAKRENYKNVGYKPFVLNHSLNIGVRFLF